MHMAFWRHALFVRGQLFLSKFLTDHAAAASILGAGDDFRGPSGQALPLSSRVSLSTQV